MLGHIVMWKLKETALGRTAEENAQIIRTMLQALPAKIPQLRTLEVSTKIITATETIDLVLYTVFDGPEDLQTYQVHPEHEKCVQFIGQVVAERRVVDYYF